MNFGSPTEINQVITDPVTADLDGDGFTDLVWPTPNSSLQVALNNSSTFTVVASPGPPIPAGGTASYNISVTQQHGQSATVTLSCSGPTELGIGCSVSPQSVAAGATTTLSLTTTGGSAKLMPPVHRLRLYAFLLPTAVVFFGGIGVSGSPLRRKRLLGLLVGYLVCLVLAFQAGCGGSSPRRPNMGTPPGTYNITITGTAGTISRSTTVDLTVQ